MIAARLLLVGNTDDNCLRSTNVEGFGDFLSSDIAIKDWKPGISRLDGFVWVDVNAHVFDELSI